MHLSPGDFKAFTLKADRPVRLSVLVTPVDVRQAASLVGISGPSKRYSAIWDTGAMMTSISPRIAADLQLKPISVVKIHAAGNSFDSPVYKVDLVLPNGLTVLAVSVSEAGNIHGADMLIGMDIITNGDFAITNAGHQTCFSFRFPSSSVHTDYVEEAKALRKKQTHIDQARKLQRKGKLR